MTTPPHKDLRYWGLRLLLPLLVASLVFNRLANYFITKDAPFLIDIADRAVASSEVKRHIGRGYTSFKITYDEHDLVKDTLPFQVRVRGRDSTLELRGFAIKRENEWVPIKVDSAYSE